MPLSASNIIKLIILDFPSWGRCEVVGSGPRSKGSLLLPHWFPTMVEWSSFFSALKVEPAVLQATACVLPVPHSLCSHFCNFHTTHLIPQTTGAQANIFLSPHFSLISQPTCLPAAGRGNDTSKYLRYTTTVSPFTLPTCTFITLSTRRQPVTNEKSEVWNHYVSVLAEGNGRKCQ